MLPAACGAVGEGASAGSACIAATASIAATLMQLSKYYYEEGVDKVTGIAELISSLQAFITALRVAVAKPDRAERLSSKL